MRSIAMNVYIKVGLVTLIGMAAKHIILIMEVVKQKLKQRVSINTAAHDPDDRRHHPC